jgi:hypothetical protein
MSGPMMNASRFRRTAQRCRTWLLCVALLVPIAQAAAAWHTAVVSGSGHVTAGDTPSFHHSHCDVCLAAAALSGGALPAAAPVPPRLWGRHEAPGVVACVSRSAPPTWAYRSRAPPPAQH